MKLLGIVCLLLFSFYQLLKLVHGIVRKKHIAQQTGLPDLPLLGVPRKDGKKIAGAAVICGGSIGGLLAARVCHDHFERVIIIEAENWLCTEESWPDDASDVKSKRSRLLQWESYQTLQAWSAACFEKLFPNLASECALSRISIIPADWKLFLSGKEIKAPKNEYNGSLPPIICAGRPGLETLIRRLVVGRKQYPNVEMVQGTVTGYEADPEQPGYLSKVLFRRAIDNKIISIPATMVIDCTGPASAGVKMLRRLGHGVPTGSSGPSLDGLTTHYDQDFRYSSFDIPVTDDLIQRFPKEAREPGPIRYCLPEWTMDRRMVLSQRIDRNIVQVVAAGWSLEQIPTTLEEVETLARSLNLEIPIPEWWFEVLHILKDVEMTTKVARIPHSVYTLFHRAENMPSNWVAIGDSVMTINPIFAQGISKIFLGLAPLNSMLHQEGPDQLTRDFAKKFFNAQAEKLEPHWGAVKGIDYNYETTTPIVGETLSDDWFIRSYIRAFMRLATKNTDASSAMWRVMNFLAPPIDYFHPYLVPQVLWEMTKERRNA
ncbi:hypothetical protein M378DRAFT_15278 [Amanita muscaria Koide BX008]|uniref:Uncharacterized protein n=1 Tax=Amanita muscaria (strain Koide BX008) TaxID=946122 RepID=A0A0C2WBW6_AMAMK|nr:hypothetical protein M378DRAFT_15278 [Amanita muscaria Koide BX008]